ncbi:MAG: hypothetical protein AAGD14_05045 [Planctomycetota bacterium]
MRWAIGLLLLYAAAPFDPTDVARRSIGTTVNFEAVIPAMCYTKTDGVSNPCYVCHTVSRFPNAMDDAELQEEYAFSDFARDNRWSNLFVDRTKQIEAVSDEAILAWVREDNYEPLRRAMRDAPKDYGAWRPDLDFRAGFDDAGFARDGSGWRAFRYKPFPGTFFPAAGSTDDVMIRLPATLRASPAQARLNYALLEAAMATHPDHEMAMPTEPLDEAVARFDLNGDGRIGGTIRRIRRLPTHYVGTRVKIHRYVFPVGTAFLHTVRYLDPDEPSMIARRMKEVRYMVKTRWLDRWGFQKAYENEHEEKDEGRLPQFSGTPLTGVNSDFGWRFTAFIEDGQGRLRLQTEEEHRFCMGCHSTVGVTVDSTFSFARKVPGEWRYQSLVGLRDQPPAGGTEPEYLTYFRRVRGGDEFRGNTEFLRRFLPEGKLDEASVRRAAPGGDRDVRHLILPSRRRALRLNKAYRLLVGEQRFDLGRDTVLAPLQVHPAIREESTGLGETEHVFRDGQLWLGWK